MWRFVWLAAAGCGFTPGMLLADAATELIDTPVGTPTCPSPNWVPPQGVRFAIDSGGAPAGYTITVDVTAALALGVELRVLDDSDVEHDRILASSLLDVRVPASGTLYVYAGNAVVPPLASPDNVYMFAESFDALPVGDKVATKLAARPSADWGVIDDTGAAGNRVLHAGGVGRHPCAFVGMTLANGDIRARMRVGPGGTQQHNGLAARGNSMIEATMDGFVGQLMGNINRSRIAEYTNGASPPIELVGLDGAVTRSQWYALRLRFIGNALDFYIDGALTLSTIKTGSDGQLIGLYAHDTDVDYDDITVRPAMSPEPAAALGPREDRCP